MEFTDIHIGMLCDSKKGPGTVIDIDGVAKTLHLSDVNNNKFEVNFEDLVEDVQVHNRGDIYY